jgi:2-succinyl-5-enolpyruvyl-6-hydroxy-3-cyclohexene-1-carboxylate synthase
MNEKWCTCLIDQLTLQGVNYFCIAPGSRSTPLVLAIAAHPHAHAMVHFDERGAAFHALGVAKATGKPAAVVVTSGTAVGNLYPAVMEASLTRTPLILLTADRPPELRDCGANQTLDQVKIFGSFLRWEIDLPCPDSALLENYLQRTVAYAVMRACASPFGPVQLNCMFREPLFSPSFESEALSHAPIIYASGACEPDTAHLQEWARALSQVKKGVILAGILPPYSSLSSLYALAESLKWPIFPDILSGIRSHGAQESIIAHYDLILKSLPDLFKVDAVLHLGDQFVSKTLLEWIDRCKPSLYFSVADHPYRHDPKHSVTHRISCDPLSFCKKLLPILSASSSEWLSEWKFLSREIEEEPLQEKMREESAILSEPEIIFSLNTLPETWALFLANSMPIRDADLFFFPKEKKGPIFGNRGVSGIDGNIATAIGIAQGSKRPTVALLGDQAALHDINSLAQLKKADIPVIFLIINNGGGGIFSFLPIAQKKDIMEEYFAASHSYSFEAAAALFQIPYFRPTSRENWQFIWEETLDKQESCLIEVVTSRHENALLHQKFYATLKEKLCSNTLSLGLRLILPFFFFTAF